MSTVAEDPWRLQPALEGDEMAWRALVDEFAGSIWHWARSHGLSRDEAEDVSQTVWYKLKDKGHSISDPARLPGWLATTTKREAISVIRRRRAELDEFGEDTVIDLRSGDPGLAEVAEANDLQVRLAAAFTTLTAQCQQLLSLCWSGTLSYEEIAEIMGRSVGYVGPTRRRCLDALRQRAGVPA
jgi:RNA polymerase sigma factor (sigma-70 family)